MIFNFLFPDKDKFIDRMQVLTNQVRKEPAQPGEKVMLPNDPEIEISLKRKNNGIPIDNKTYSALKIISIEYNVPLKVLPRKND